MLEKIEDINLLNLAKDIKEMISDGKLKIKTDDYQVELEVNNDFKELKALKRLLEIMVHENFLMTELYFENKDDAIIKRLKAELQYFGEICPPNKELYEKYKEQLNDE